MLASFTCEHELCTTLRLSGAIALALLAITAGCAAGSPHEAGQPQVELSAVEEDGGTPQSALRPASDAGGVVGQQAPPTRSPAPQVPEGAEREPAGGERAGHGPGVSPPGQEDPLAGGAFFDDSPRPAAADLPWRLTAAQLEAGRSRVAARVRACSAGATGQVQLTVVISGPTGRVTSAQVTDEFAGTPVGECAARAAREEQFPRFRERSMTISFPPIRLR